MEEETQQRAERRRQADALEHTLTGSSLEPTPDSLTANAALELLEMLNAAHPGVARLASLAINLAQARARSQVGERAGVPRRMQVELITAAKQAEDAFTEAWREQEYSGENPSVALNPYFELLRFAGGEPGDVIDVLSG